ncbi:methyltransferase domain-containing protein [Granulicella cerasi]|uniref:Methyltransferase domain-containing protein n=1 Tax=Granulicella cerasi TaxID=741063 RepID=A0ABW1Z9R6_9BACT|nr:methyltransferase domain-containing protein [Granulicella cerasi]
MNSSAPPPLEAATPPALPGFEVRTYDLHEHLDGPCTYAEYRRAMLDMGKANKLTRAFKPFVALVAEVITRTGVGTRPLHVVDLGCGQGDLLRPLRRWAAPLSVPLRLTGIDLHPYAMRLAQELDEQAHVPQQTFHWLTADALTTTLDVDVITCSLMAHHLRDKDVVRLLQRCDEAREAWMISDLRRSERAAKIFVLLARVFRWHRFVLEDGDISFRRAFSLDEWRALVAQANVRAEVIDAGGGRVLVRSRRQRENV